MDYQEEFIFWKLAHYLIFKQKYRIIQLSKGQNELWLEKIEHKEAQLIRLLSYNLDWSNWLQKDIEITAHNGERIRKQLAKGNMNLLNIYVSAFPPVDDYEYRIKEPFHFPEKGKTRVDTILMDREHHELAFDQFGKLFHDHIPVPAKGEYALNDVMELKNITLTEAVKEEKKERALFEMGKPFFTYVFIIVQVMVFLFLEFNGGSTNTATLLKYGAKFNPFILDGEWWRFFTPIFIHIGFLHLLMNTLALYYLGITVEKIYGKFRFVFIYITAGFGGTLASFIFSESLSAGASGAIFGCFGALLYFGLIYRDLFRRTMGANILMILGINLVLGLIVPGIDSAGHIGGLIGGFLATGVVHFPKQKKRSLQLLFMVLTAFTISGLLIYGYYPS